MIRRVLLAAALVTAALGAPAATAVPPYCVSVTSGGTTVTQTCAIGTDCMLYGFVDNLAWCVLWP